MNIAESTSESPVAGMTTVEKRVILSMGGKGGVGIMPPAGLCRIYSQSYYFCAVQPLTCAA
jgi:hypothetical protein